MPDSKTIHQLDQALAADPAETFLVRGEDLRRWIETERDECIKIAERHLGQLYHGHGATGEQVISAIIAEMRARSASA